MIHTRAEVLPGASARDWRTSPPLFQAKSRSTVTVSIPPTLFYFLPSAANLWHISSVPSQRRSRRNKAFLNFLKPSQQDPREPKFERQAEQAADFVPFKFQLPPFLLLCHEPSDTGWVEHHGTSHRLHTGIEHPRVSLRIPP